MKLISLIFAISILLLSCNKDNSDNTPPPVNSVQPVTYFEIQHLGSIPPSILVFKNSGVISNVFKLDATAGIYTAEYHGLNGRDLIQGSAKFPFTGSTNLGQWNINDGDTIRVFKNGVKYIDYITSTADGINGQIVVERQNNETEAQMKARINTYVSPVGDMRTQKFKQN